MAYVNKAFNFYKEVPLNDSLKPFISSKETFVFVVKTIRETAGRFYLYLEIKLVLSGGLKIELKFFKDKNMDGLLLRAYTLINDYIVG